MTRARTRLVFRGELVGDVLTIAAGAWCGQTDKAGELVADAYDVKARLLSMPGDRLLVAAADVDIDQVGVVLVESVGLTIVRELHVVLTAGVMPVGEVSVLAIKASSPRRAGGSQPLASASTSTEPRP